MTEIAEETRTKIHELCKNYLGGNWAQLGPDELIIKPVPHGNLNKLLFAFLPDHLDHKYKRVIVRFDTKIEEATEFKSETHMIAMNVIMSEKGITPKLLAISSDAMINEMIDARFFNATDDRTERRVRMLATRLADFHSQRMPLPKGRNPLFDSILDNDNPFYQMLSKCYDDGPARKLINELDCPTHKELHLLDEMRWLNGVIKKMDNPIVFSHNDFNRKNILVEKSDDPSQEQIYIIDFDWTNYNYRGIDLGQYFCSWDQSEPEFGVGDFPSDQDMSVFINAYINRMSEIFGESYAKQDINSRERLIKESKIFAMSAYHKDNFYFVWQMSLNEGSPKNIEYMETAERRFGLYKKLKEKVLREYSDIS